ncbi:MAG: N-acetyltransferase family protein [Anaerolineae bacterium]
MTTIRLATEHDAEGVLAIYTPVVLETPISFEIEPPDAEEMRGRIRKALTSHVWLVCESDAGEVLGYVYGGKIRERFAYQWSTEVTAYVHPKAYRGGVGRALYTSLFAVLRLQGYYNAFAGIAMPNDASVGLHKAVGFEYIGVYHRIGYKFGRWHDVSWWERSLQAHDTEPTTPQPVETLLDHAEWQAAVQAGLPLLHI